MALDVRTENAYRVLGSIIRITSNSETYDVELLMANGGPSGGWTVIAESPSYEGALEIQREILCLWFARTLAPTNTPEHTLHDIAHEAVANTLHVYDALQYVADEMQGRLGNA